jgi:hypothetical protein
MTRAPMDDTILPIPIRVSTTVYVQGLPLDLTADEARKVCTVIMAFAEPEPEEEQS